MPRHSIQKYRSQTRARFNRASMNSAILAALRLHARPVYVYPTAGGFQVGSEAPPYTQYVEVAEDAVAFVASPSDGRQRRTMAYVDDTQGTIELLD